ncbi:MAG: hypothetical protein IIT41_01865, partial [Oscillospiraceae bacterium]|nr:hypothetical protein [Oscillospiraceae bacterium]
PGRYNLSEAIGEIRNNGEMDWLAQHPELLFEDMYDGCGVLVRGVDGLTIRGTGEVELVLNGTSFTNSTKPAVFSTKTCGADKIKITLSGTVFRLRGKGIPYLRSQDRRGDQFVTVSVEIPKGLTKEQRELVEKLASSMNEKSPNLKKKKFWEK